MTVFRIPNREARALWLHKNALSDTPTGPLDTARMIRRLGFVQLDSIQVVARAHHHILWTRNQSYREPMLDPVLSQDRAVFEHFTHDASVLPMETLPLWQRQFRRKREQYSRAGWVKGLPDADARARIKARIAQEGPLSSRDFEPAPKASGDMWSRPPHKLALDYMWYAGELATAHRVNFFKYYDLAERVFPAHLHEQDLPDAQQIDGLCRMALDRLGVASAGDIMRFWEAVSLPDVRSWIAAQGDAVIEAEVQAADGTWVPTLAWADLPDQISTLPEPTSRLRILNPFDPAIRDRTRLKRLFGFDYTVEMFVPAAKRIWGYYVYPLLEGVRMVGRIEVKANRKSGELAVLNLWAEPKVRWTDARQSRLDAELDRMRRFVGLDRIVWSATAQRPSR